MTIIQDILARKIFDSRGNPTIEVEVYTDSGFGRAAAPAGASTGTYEAVVIPVDDAILKLETEVAEQLVGEDASMQADIDYLLHEIDGTDNFSNIGGNTSVAISMAVAWAAADAYNLPLYRYLSGPYQRIPYPLGNALGGGAHAKGATDIQEFLITPVGASLIDEAVYANTLVHKRVKKLLTDEGVVCGKGDEGGWAPQVTDAKAFEIVSKAVDEVSDEMGFEIRFGLDVAATELWNGSHYVYKDRKRTTEEQIEYIAGLIDEYDLYYVEDPLHENDFEGFASLTEKVGDRCIICGDDLFVTNVDRITKGIEMFAANAVLIKPNQIGTVTDTFNAIQLARKYGYSCIMSHRSGETTDNTIAHLSVAFGCELIKTGIVGGERIAKLNELIRIGEEIGSDRMTES
ncbi:phosphopyruvate hydratase [Methanocella sp. CWC-04]|uniref:Enolase n=1 Tax=Methanooceanicella nereidis TaxID=2052831 RepID=A0AAP2W581_9EURY|nr:phosphopyruvate hydratase [Methanocella sp. CWC-04]MCD1293892.1 phosphopyruvate hydratase [Methanocella sp. CWC-04]